MKLKLLLTSVCVVFLVISEFGGFFASANFAPIYTNIEISPQSVGATPPTVTFLSPENYKTYGSNLTLHCKISLGEVSQKNISCSIENLYYQADWETQPTKVIRLQLNKDSTSWDTVIAGTVSSDYTEYSNNLTAPTEGEHHIIFWAVEKGSYEVDIGKQFPAERINVYSFYINSSQTVAFTVDNSPSSPTPSPTIPELSIVSVMPILALASVSLIYLNRCKCKPLLENS